MENEIKKFEVGKTYYTFPLPYVAVTIKVTKRTVKMIFVETNDDIFVTNGRYMIFQDGGIEYVKLGSYANAEWICASDEYTESVKAIESDNRQKANETIAKINEVFAAQVVMPIETADVENYVEDDGSNDDEDEENVALAIDYNFEDDELKDTYGENFFEKGVVNKKDICYNWHIKQKKILKGDKKMKYDVKKLDKAAIEIMVEFLNITIATHKANVDAFEKKMVAENAKIEALKNGTLVCNCTVAECEKALKMYAETINSENKKIAELEARISELETSDKTADEFETAMLECVVSVEAQEVAIEAEKEIAAEIKGIDAAIKEEESFITNSQNHIDQRKAEMAEFDKNFTELLNEEGCKLGWLVSIAHSIEIRLAEIEEDENRIKNRKAKIEELKKELAIYTGEIEETENTAEIETVNVANYVEDDGSNDDDDDENAAMTIDYNFEVDELKDTYGEWKEKVAPRTYHVMALSAKGKLTFDGKRISLFDANVEISLATGNCSIISFKNHFYANTRQVLYLDKAVEENLGYNLRYQKLETLKVVDMGRDEIPYINAKVAAIVDWYQQKAREEDAKKVAEIAYMSTPEYALERISDRLELVNYVIEVRTERMEKIKKHILYHVGRIMEYEDEMYETMLELEKQEKVQASYLKKKAYLESKIVQREEIAAIEDYVVSTEAQEYAVEVEIENAKKAAEVFDAEKLAEKVLNSVMEFDTVKTIQFNLQNFGNVEVGNLKNLAVIDTVVSRSFNVTSEDNEIKKVLENIRNFKKAVKTNRREISYYEDEICNARLIIQEAEQKIEYAKKSVRTLTDGITEFESTLRTLRPWDYWDATAEKLTAEFNKIPYEDSTAELMKVVSTEGEVYSLPRNFGDLNMQTLHAKMLIMLNGKVLASYITIEELETAMTALIMAIRNGAKEFIFPADDSETIETDCMTAKFEVGDCMTAKFEVGKVYYDTDEFYKVRVIKRNKASVKISYDSVIPGAPKVEVTCKVKIGSSGEYLYNKKDCMTVYAVDDVEKELPSIFK